MSTEINVIAIAIESIKNDDIPLLDKCMKIMPLEKIEDKHDILLSTFLANCAAYQRNEAAKMVMERWKVLYPDNDKLSIFSRLFMNLKINMPTLAYIASIHEENTFVELIDELAEWDSSEEVATACMRADQIYGDQPYDTYKILREHAVEFQNTKVQDFVIEKITEVGPFAPKPEYVKNYLKYEKLPTQEELDELARKQDKEEKYVLPDDEEAVRIMTEGLEDLGISILEMNEARAFLREKIRDPEEKKKLLLPILKNLNQLELETDRLLYWIYGPTHQIVNQDLTLNTPSAKYGGCRMFLCNLFDYNEDEGEFEDFFTGYCQQCLLRIQKRCYSVRKPRPLGGWDEGSFCSFECVRKRVEQIEIEQNKPDILTHELVNVFEKKIKEVGIQDRD